MTKSIGLCIILFAALLLAGCGVKAPAQTSAPPQASNAIPAFMEPQTSEKPQTSQSPEETPVSPEPEAAVSPSLADTITLPDGWTMDQAISVSEIEALVGDTGYSYFPEAASDAPKGNPAGAFVQKNANGKRKLTIFAFVSGKEAKYSFFKDYFVEGSLLELESELWDKALVGDLKDGSAAIVALRGDLCFRITWFPEAYPQRDKKDFGADLARLLINNLYGGERPPLSAGGTGASATAAGNTPSAESDPGLPDTLPPELVDVAALNQYAVNLWMEYIKPNIFEASLFSDEEKDSARKALKLIIAAEDKAIGLYDGNESLYYLRGTAYAQCYYDTKDTAYKDMAMADLKKAADMGLAAAQAEYDKVSGK